ncbi:transposase [bacterium]|nr:transposase [bacterium]
MERFFRSLKEECTWEESFPDFHTGKVTVTRWVQWYNVARPHQSLGYLSPQEYRQPFDLIAVALAGEKEKTAPEEAVQCDLEKWLPGPYPPRTISGPDLEDEVELFGIYVRRRLKLVFRKPAEKAFKYGVHRRWLRNPVVVAREIAAEMDSIPGATQETVALARGVTRTRVCQYLRLLLLPPDILDFICNPANEANVARVTEGSLRHLLREPTPVEARRAFYAMIEVVNIGRNTKENCNDSYN